MRVEPGEIILVAGKGHEESKFINKIYNVSDKKIIKILVKSKKLSNKNWYLDNKLILQKIIGKKIC